MNPILQGLQEGYGEEEILSFLTKAIPQLGNTIKKASKSGYGTREILGFLSKNFDTESLRGKSESQIHGINRRADAERAKYGLKAVATAVAAPIAGNMARSALSRALPRALAPASDSLIPESNIPGPTSPAPQQTSQQPTGINPTGQQSQNISSQPPVNQVSQNIPQVPETTQPEEIPINNKFVETPIGQLLEIPKAGSQVGSKYGMGEVKAIRNGKAIVEVDGKKHQVDEDELIESPLPEKDLADLYTDLIGGIEKTTGQQVSRNVEYAGYDPNFNELVYKPHGSDKVYVYDDISPEDAKQLTSFINQRKSSGGNYIGAWEKGTESPIGAGMYQLIKKLQSERGGKGNEYRNRFETIYDALEPAKQAAKKKHAKAKKKAKKSGIA